MKLFNIDNSNLKNLSLNDLLQPDFPKLQNLYFQLISGESNANYFQIKVKALNIDSQSSIMFQLIDTSAEIMFEKEQSHSKVLALINATVSHELRNPLNAINAINLQK